MRDRYECHDWDYDGFPPEFMFGDDFYVAEEYGDERWKKILDCDGYFISNYGRVYSVKSNRFIAGTIIGNGYVDFSLKDKNNNRVHKYLHRLLAEYFKPNHECFPMVRHLDDNPSNNDLDNLAWGTQSDNMQDAIRNGSFRRLSDDDRERAMQKRRMRVTGISPNNEIHIFPSQQEAARSIGISQTTISDYIRGRRKSAKGWIFRKEALV